MGIKNTTLNLTDGVARFKGEREKIAAEIESLQSAIERLPSLRERSAKLDDLIKSAEMIIREHHPDWSSDLVAPVRTTNHASPIPYGELGRTVLEVMQDAPPEGWPAREIARRVMKRFGL